MRKPTPAEPVRRNGESGWTSAMTAETDCAWCHHWTITAKYIGG
jgi:hypothetical protein